MNLISKMKSLAIAGVLISTLIQAQLPTKVLVGYWENWGNLRLKDVDDRYNVLCLSFLEADKGWPATPDDNVVGDLEFTPTNATTLKADIPVVQAEGKRVIISIGGANGSFKLNNTTDKNTFVSKIKDFIQEYGVDGIDLDFERQVYVCATGSANISNPTDAHITNLVAGVKELLTWYQSTYGKKMLLTMAPETIYVQGGLSNWAVNNACGGHYLAIIEQLRDDIDLMMVQLYNSGSLLDLNGAERFQGTQEFVTSSTETVIRGFTSKGGLGSFSGLPASKVVVALPSCSGSGYVSSANLEAAMNYLIGEGPKAGSYTLKQAGGYPDLRGMMTWSANGDAGCGYGFAQVFENVYGTIPNQNSIHQITINKLELFPNPTSENFSFSSEKLIGKTLNILDFNGKTVKSIVINSHITTVDVKDLAKGFYTVQTENNVGKLIVR